MNNITFTLNGSQIDASLSGNITFTLNDEIISYTVNATVENLRLLENGDYRILEDGSYRLLE